MEMSEDLAGNVSSVIERLKECCDKKTARYGWANEEGQGVYSTTVCHAGLSQENHPLVIVNFNQTHYAQSHGPGYWTDTTDEMKEAFLDWLMNRSAYAKAFITKDPKEQLAQGYSLLRTDVYGHTLGAACVAQRNMWEHTSILVAWYDLVKAGTPEDMAFFVAHMMSFNKDKNGGVGFNATRGHVVLDSGSFYKKNLHNFLGNTPRVTEMFLESHDYGQYGYDAWGERAYGITMSTEVNNLAKIYLRECPASVKSNNPFIQKPTNTLTYSKAIEFVSTNWEKFL
jgi:hypothetical protein